MGLRYDAACSVVNCQARRRMSCLELGGACRPTQTLISPFPFLLPDPKDQAKDQGRRCRCVVCGVWCVMSNEWGCYAIAIIIITIPIGPKKTYFVFYVCTEDGYTFLFGPLTLTLIFNGTWY